MASKFVISYLEINNLLKFHSNNISVVYKYVQNNYQLSDDEFQIVSNKIRAFFGHYQRKLLKNDKSHSNLLKDPWMQGKIEVIFEKCVKEKSAVKRGRPKKSFDDCSERSKRRKIQELCCSTSHEQIKLAAVRKLKKPVSKLVQHILTTDNITALSDKLDKDEVNTLSANEALLFLIEAKLTSGQYIQLRNLVKSCNAKIFPPYYKVAEAKAKCYPDLAAIEISEHSASITLQVLLNHTAARTLESMDEQELQSVPENLIMLSKYGCDGASNQSQYKQKSTNEDFTDASIFMVSLVPLRIAKDCDLKSVYWKNERPGSGRYCRPLKFVFAKETEERTSHEIDAVKNQISKLTESKISIGGKNLCVTHKLFLTMVDGKVCQALSYTASASTCYVCQATPKQMNDISKVLERDEDVATFEYGLSPLHAKIRFMEFILHIAYNMTFQHWQASKRNGKLEDKRQNKKRIQKEFKERLGLKVDVVKRGSGTTNDGNTARRFFADPATTASITLVDENIIRRCSIILTTLACNRYIDADKFHEYAMETYALFVEKYEWYYIPCSVHKTLVHGRSIIQNSLLPIGSLTEEASEARNKDFRWYREHNTRKCNRVATNQDLINMLLVSSDPLLSNMRPVLKKKTSRLPEEARNLLVADEFNNRGDDVEDTD